MSLDNTRATKLSERVLLLLVDGNQDRQKSGDPLYNRRIMAFLNAQLEKLRGLDPPANASADDVAAYNYQLGRAERCLAKHADNFDVRDFYSTQDACLAVEEICAILREKIEKWGMAGVACIQDSVPETEVDEDEKFMAKLLNYILKGAKCNVHQELLQRWEPYKQHHADNMKLVRIIDESTLQLEKKLGSGGHGTVFKALWKTADVAVKQPFKNWEGDLPIKAFAGFFKEAIQHTLLNNHPNIIQLLATTISGWIVLELADCNLHKLCHGMGALTWRLKARLLRQGAAGLEYIHDKKIVHGDIKPCNLLLVGTQAESLQLKISDFGLSFQATQSKSKTIRRWGGTQQYIAPETYEDKPINQASDVYSFGVVCYEVITQKHPFGGGTVHQSAVMAKKLSKKEPCPVEPQDCPPQVLELIRQCCALDPAERPTMAEVSRRLSSLSDSWNSENCKVSCGTALLLEISGQVQPLQDCISNA